MEKEKIQEQGKKNTIKTFVDLDDTLSSNKTMFYSKLKFLLQIKKIPPQKAFDIIRKDFEINTDFLEIMQNRNDKKLYILSRNNNDFVEYFIQHSKKIFEKHNIECIGGTGGMHTKQKKEIVPKGSIFIGDIFEYKQWKNDPRFVCIESYSHIKKLYKITIKLYRLFIYIFKHIGKNI